MTYLNANHYATSTVNRVMSTLRLFFKYLQLQGEVEYNPTELIQGAKSSKRLPKVISSKQVDQLMNAPNTSTNKGIRDRAILELMYATGLRVSELIHLTRDDLHLDLGFIQTLGKGNKERIIPLGEEAIYWLDRYLNEVYPLYNLSLIHISEPTRQVR